MDWFAGSCGGAPVPGGASPSVSSASTTTYYARARNTTTECGSANCASVTFTVVETCDDSGPRMADSCVEGQCVHTPLDADSDGVPDCGDLCLNTPSGEPVNPQGCACSQLDCNDNDSCTDDICTAGVCSHPLIDADSDGICDADDNCSGVANPLQADSGGVGDACDSTDDDGDFDAEDVRLFTCALLGLPPDCNP